MKPGEYWTLVITMIVGGLVYSIVSFSYMTSSFVPIKRVDRMEDRLNSELRIINNKLDKLIQRGN